MSSSHAQPTTADSEVVRAILGRSLQRLQELSLRPGGFGHARQQAWIFLLGVESSVLSEFILTSPQDSSLSGSWTQSSAPTSPKAPPSSSLDGDPSNMSDGNSNNPSHPDAHQVQLDTNRSFILYPVENRTTSQRKSLQHDLHDIILGVLEKRPKLRYFQGYHDIITVLFLTLPAEVVLPSAEKISLHRLRDSMGTGLDPLVGQLRILKRLLRLIDPPYAEILERNSPLPYYALSNLLTLFSHDVPTLPLIQHVFDWLLCREPIAAIWLAAAVILCRKQDILALEREGDEAMGMVHAVLSALPALSDDEPSHLDDDPPNAGPPERLDESPGSIKDFMDEKSRIESGDNHISRKGFAEKSPAEVVYTEAEKGDKKSYTSFGDSQVDYRDVTDRTRSPTSDSLLDSWTEDMPRALPPSVEHRTALSSAPISATVEAKDTHLEVTPEAETRPRRESTSPPRSRSQSRSPPGGYREKRSPRPLPLSTLLGHASELLATYPPSSPTLHLAETFGQQSALHPGSSSTVILSELDDDEADSCVGGENVVLPPTQEEQDEESGPPRKSREADRRPQPGKAKGGSIRRAKGMAVRRQTVVAGVVLLLGVAVALYGFGPGRGPVRHNNYRFVGDRRVAAWVGGLLGLGQRLGLGI